MSDKIIGRKVTRTFRGEEATGQVVGLGADGGQILLLVEYHGELQTWPVPAAGVNYGSGDAAGATVELLPREPGRLTTLSG
ncbi:hypothetical protein [Miltoncostaea marina]|uniref:hypothetical protein n=1 Tax=Miltoncostaea marina TaxID=2843215 RepID=UPI001C3E2A71|nr:hypothetical protein [Miltoncostaea marina]